MNKLKELKHRGTGDIIKLLPPRVTLPKARWGRNKHVIYNACPHEIQFTDDLGEQYFIKSCGFALTANVVTKTLFTQKGIEYVEIVGYEPTSEGLEWLRRIRCVAPDALVVGSLIAAQAYPGVLAMVPHSESRGRTKEGRRFIVFPPTNSKK
jgi:hypothetical protein